MRHRSWEDADVRQQLRERGVGWCLVDQPPAGSQTIPPLPWVTADVAYLRLHGRNTADWFRPDAGRDARYDYLYDAEQLAEVVVTRGSPLHLRTLATARFSASYGLLPLAIHRARARYPHGEGEATIAGGGSRRIRPMRSRASRTMRRLASSWAG